MRLVVDRERAADAEREAQRAMKQLEWAVESARKANDERLADALTHLRLEIAREVQRARGRR